MVPLLEKIPKHVSTPFSLSYQITKKMPPNLDRARWHKKMKGELRNPGPGVIVETPDTQAALLQEQEASSFRKGILGFADFQCGDTFLFLCLVFIY